MKRASLRIGSMLVMSCALILAGCSLFDLFYPEWKAPPVALIDVAQHDFYMDEEIFLDGSRSHDPNCGPSPLSFQWSCSPEASLTAAKSAETFLVPLRPQEYEVTLQVYDGYNHDATQGIDSTRASCSIRALEDWEKRQQPSGEWPNSEESSNIEYGEAFSSDMSWCRQEVDNETATAANGFLHMETGSSLLLLTKDIKRSDCDVRAEFVVPSSGSEQWFGIGFRIPSSDITPQDENLPNGLYFLARTKNNGEVAYLVVQQGVAHFARDWRPCPAIMDPRVPCELRVVMKGPNLEFYFGDDVLFLGNDGVFGEGYTGLALVDGAVQVENIVIRE